MEPIVFSHYSVLLNECIEALNIRNGYTYVDCTTGGGGHSLEIAKRLGPDSRLICFDRDADAIAVATERLARFGERSTIVHSNFSEVKSVLLSMGIERIDGILLDLGVSSYQLDCAERGFSYMNDAPLDMRMDQRDAITAYDVVNGYSASELK